MSLNPLEWHASWPVVFGALWVIVLARSNATYWVGRAVLAGATHTRVVAFTQTTSFVRAQTWVSRWGSPVVAVSFLTVGVQTAVNLAAGVARMPLRHYLPASALGGAVWAAVYATVGIVGFKAIALVWDRSPAWTITLLVAAMVSLTVFVARRLRRPGAPTPTN